MFNARTKDVPQTEVEALAATAERAKDALARYQPDRVLTALRRVTELRDERTLLNAKYTIACQEAHAAGAHKSTSAMAALKSSIEEKDRELGPLRVKLREAREASAPGFAAVAAPFEAEALDALRSAAATIAAASAIFMAIDNAVGNNGLSGMVPFRDVRVAALIAAAVPLL